MTVSELIEKLRSFPPAMRVVTRGFDEAYIDDVKTIEIVHVKFRRGPGGHFGDHLEDPDGEPALLVDY